MGRRDAHTPAPVLSVSHFLSPSAPTDLGRPEFHGPPCALWEHELLEGLRAWQRAAPDAVPKRLQRWLRHTNDPELFSP